MLTLAFVNNENHSSQEVPVNEEATLSFQISDIFYKLILRLIGFIMSIAS